MMLQDLAQVQLEIESYTSGDPMKAAPIGTLRLQAHRQQMAFQLLFRAIRSAPDSLLLLSLGGRMSASIRRCLLTLLSVAFLAISQPATADSITLAVSGSGYLGGTYNGLSVNGGNLFSIYSAAPDGPAILDSGTVGVSMDLTIYPSAFSGYGFTDVRIGGAVTDILNGGLMIASGFTVPASALMTGSFTAPVTVSGFLQAYTDLTYGTGILTQGPLLGTVDFSGQGMGTFSIQPTGADTFVIVYEFGQFKGTGTLNTTVHLTPEPTSLVLVGTGLAALALVLKRRTNVGCSSR